METVAALQAKMAESVDGVSATHLYVVSQSTIHFKPSPPIIEAMHAHLAIIVLPLMLAAHVSKLRPPTTRSVHVSTTSFKRSNSTQLKQMQYALSFGVRSLDPLISCSDCTQATRSKDRSELKSQMLKHAKLHQSPSRTGAVIEFLKR